MSFCLWWQHPGLHKKCQVASQGWVLEVPNMVLNGQFMCFFNDGMMHALFLRLVSSLFFSCLPKKYEAVVRPRSHSPQRKKNKFPPKPCTDGSAVLQQSLRKRDQVQQLSATVLVCLETCWDTSYLSNNSTSWLPKKKCTFVSEGYFGTNADRRQQVESKLKETA